MFLFLEYIIILIFIFIIHRLSFDTKYIKVGQYFNILKLYGKNITITELYKFQDKT